MSRVRRRAADGHEVITCPKRPSADGTIPQPLRSLCQESWRWAQGAVAADSDGTLLPDGSMVTSFGYQVCGHSSSATKPFVSLRGTYTARVDANRHAGSCSISWETSK